MSMPLILLYLKSNPPRVLSPSPNKVLFHFTILQPPFIYLRLPLSYVIRLITGHANLFVTLTVDLYGKKPKWWFPNFVSFCTWKITKKLFKIGSYPLKVSHQRKNAMGTNVLKTETPTSIDDAVYFLKENFNEGDHRPAISFGFGDPSCFECFRTTPIAEDAIVEAVRSAKFNSYAPTGGILTARRAVADYLSRDLPYRLSPDDVYLTLGCNQAAEITIKVLARPGANILLPRPGYPDVETYAIFNNLEIRQFDLLPERGWEVDLDAVEAISDENTIAMVIINPGNPSGSVYTYNHLNKIAETARKLGILVIADEVYGHLFYGSSPFVPMSLFATIVPVITLGSVSKRWMIPGWGLGWLVTCDPSGLLRKDEIAESINKLLVYSPFPPTLIQGAIPQILEKTTQDFFSKTINILRKNLDICYDKLMEIPCIMIPQRPEGAFFAMVKLNLLLLEDIEDDMEFCLKLAKEESLIILPGVTVGLKNWLRVTFAVEYSSLEDGLGRLKSFCQRHAKKYSLTGSTAVDQQIHVEH